MNRLTHKGYGRIYVDNQEDIQKVKDIIKELDEFEFGYLPTEYLGKIATTLKKRTDDFFVEQGKV